jgi:hypothetical protein
VSAAGINLARLEQDLARIQETYHSARPFPHVVIDDFLEPEAAELAMKEFPPLDDDVWNNYVHANERKYAHNNPDTWGPTLQSILQGLNSERFVRFVSDLTGFEGLVPDESLEGGGLHQSTTGGFLNIHADFTVHPHRQRWRRRANLLLYLNEDWRPDYGGDLELWSSDMKRCETKIAPKGNRVVIFTTDVDSYHGHPDPMRCPPGVCRRSLALYYFSIEDRPLVRATDYRPRPGDGARSLMIYADKQMLRTYDWAKRRLNLSDETASRILARLERLRRKSPSARG